MFIAKGVSFLNLPSGLTEARIEYVDERTGETVGRHTYVVTSKEALLQYVNRQLDALKAASEDEALGAGLVGQVLGTI